MTEQHINEKQLRELAARGWRYIRGTETVEASRDPERKGWTTIDVKTLTQEKGQRDIILMYGYVFDIEEL